MHALRSRRAAAAAAAAAGADPQLAALEAENARLRELVSRQGPPPCGPSGEASAAATPPLHLASNAARPPLPPLMDARACRRRTGPAAHPGGAPRAPPLPPQLADQAGQGASKTGYLCKYRGHATASLWAPTWELRCASSS